MRLATISVAAKKKPKALERIKQGTKTRIKQQKQSGYCKRDVVKTRYLIYCRIGNLFNMKAHEL